jgi:hypothetical protein
MRTGETLAAIRGKTDLAISGTGICGEPKTGTDGVTPKADASNCKTAGQPYFGRARLGNPGTGTCEEIDPSITTVTVTNKVVAIH